MDGEEWEEKEGTEESAKVRGYLIQKGLQSKAGPGLGKVKRKRVQND